MTATPPSTSAGSPPSGRAFLTVVAGMVLIVMTVIAFGVAVAIGGGDKSPAATSPAAHTQVAPLDLATVPDQIASHYRYASAHLTEYRQIPCWCGCQQFLGHRHLADCFVRADAKGFEAHAAGCAVCNAEGAIAEQMLARGQSPAEVKTAVDSRFGTTAITTPPQT